MTFQPRRTHTDFQEFINLSSFMFTCGTPFCTPHRHRRERSSHWLSHMLIGSTIPLALFLGGSSPCSGHGLSSATPGNRLARSAALRGSAPCGTQRCEVLTARQVQEDQQMVAWLHSGWPSMDPQKVLSCAWPCCVCVWWVPVLDCGHDATVWGN